ncbi:MAG: YraN family protein [Patescibacteria group bacterium]
MFYSKKLFVVKQYLIKINFKLKYSLICQFFPNLRKKTIGNYGEKLTELEYRKKGFRILDKNWSFRKGELDLIVSEKQDDDVCRETFLTIVEVKTRLIAENKKDEPPLVFKFNHAKRRILLKTVKNYLIIKNSTDNRWSFDLVLVKIDGSGDIKDMEIIKNIWLGN